MTEETTTERLIRNSIRMAAAEGIDLTADDFTIDSDGCVYLDGMYPDEWLEAMTME